MKKPETIKKEPVEVVDITSPCKQTKLKSKKPAAVNSSSKTPQKKPAKTTLKKPANTPEKKPGKTPQKKKGTDSI